MNSKIVEICREKGMTLTELGKRIGKSKQYMTALQQGRIRLKYEMALQIAEVFGLKPDDIFLPTGYGNSVHKPEKKAG